MVPTTEVVLDPIVATPQHAVPAAARRAHEFAWLRACLTVDALMLGVATTTAGLGAERAGVPPVPAPWLLGFPALVVAFLWIQKAYKPRLAIHLLDDVRTIVVASVLAAMASITAREFVGADAAAADQTLRMCAFAIVFLAGGRTVLASSEVRARRSGETLRPTLIVGAGRIGRRVARRLFDHPELGLSPVGFLDRNPLEENGGPSLPVLGASWDLEPVVREHGIEHVIVTFSTAPHDVLLRLVRKCDELGVRVAFVPRLFETMNERLTVEHIGAFPLVSVSLPNPKGWQFAVKHAVDRVVAAVLLIVLAPVLAAAAVAVGVSLGRPILFRQRRVGRDGRPFEMFKFRSMGLPPEPASHPLDLPEDTAPGGIEGSDLRSRVGILLRRTSIDELPQLVNVLRGEMSVIGPRPERPEYVGLFDGTIDRYGDRHRVKAGITGWSQVIQRPEGNTSISERAELDNYYIENWSLWLDAKIMLMTAAAVVRSFRTVE